MSKQLKKTKKSPKRVKNENWINVSKVPIDTSKMLISSWKVLISTSTMPIRTILIIFLVCFFQLKTHPYPFFWDKPHPILCLLTFESI